MASTNITFEIDEDLKSNLQSLLSDLGMDVATYFTLAAKQAVREQGMPFIPTLNPDIYNPRSRMPAEVSTKYNLESKSAVSSDDKLVEETGWEDVFRELENDR